MRWRSILFMAIGFLVYSNIWNAPFIFDDGISIVENNGIRHWDNPWLMMNAGHGTAWGRPVVQISFALNYALSGLHVWSYHLVNILIHISVAWILCELLRLLLKKTPIPETSANLFSFIITLIWFVHPLGTSAVSYTVQRAESLMALFYLFTLYFTVHAAEGKKFQIAGIISCFLGVCSKESFATAPVAALLLDWAILKNDWKNIFQARRKYYLGLCSSWILLALLMWKWPRTDSVGFTEQLSGWEYFLIQCQVIIHYFRLAIFPVGLSLDYDWPKVKTITDILPQGLFLAALFCSSVWMLWKKFACGYLIFLIFLILSPTSSLIPIYTSIASEQRMYLPLAALVILLGLAIFFLTEKLQKHQTWIRWGLASIFIFSFSTLTWIRNSDYQSETSIWQDAAQKYPHNARAWNNLGEAWYQQKNIDMAKQCFQRAIEENPHYDMGLMNFGVILGQEGKLDEGIKLLKKSLESNPLNTLARVNLALFYTEKKKLDDAEKCYLGVLQMDSLNTHANFYLAAIYFQKKQYEKGLKYVNRVLQVDPLYPRAEELKNALTGHFLNSGR